LPLSRLQCELQEQQEDLTRHANAYEKVAKAREKRDHEQEPILFLAKSQKFSSMATYPVMGMHPVEERTLGAA
jgi:hypothetical protein